MLPQEPSSHTAKPRRSLFARTPLQELEEGRPGKRRESWEEERGGAWHSLLRLSPISPGSLALAISPAPPGRPNFQCLELRPAKSLWPPSQRPRSLRSPWPLFPLLIPGMSPPAPASCLTAVPRLGCFGLCCPHRASPGSWEVCSKIPTLKAAPGPFTPPCFHLP